MDVGGTNPVDVTGFTARMHVRSTLESPAVLVELTTENGRITLGDAEGTVFLELEATATALLPTKRAPYYDLEIINVEGRVKRLLQGRLQVSPEVTR
jgi:hypothetical protein